MLGLSQPSLQLSEFGFHFNEMLIQNGTIIDGKSKPRYKADLRIIGDKISDIGKLTARKKEKIINAEGKFVTPGFIDIINRSDIRFSLFEQKGLRSLLKQGITTILGGSCGASLAPIVSKESIRPIQKWEDISKFNASWSTTREFLDEVERHSPSLNLGTLTGHATLRRGLVGDCFRKLTSEDLKKMEYLVEQSMEDGSFGMSAGLAYTHERAADTEELDRLAKVVKREKGFVAVHLRDEGKGLLNSVEEIIALAGTSKVSVHISHLKAFGKESWGMFPRVLANIEKAKEEGIKISFDVYPYAVTATVLYLLLPSWVTEGNRKEVLERFRNKTTRDTLRDELKEKTEELGRIVIARGDLAHAFIGKTLNEVARNQEAGVADALLSVILASEDQVIGFMSSLNDQNVETAVLSKAGFIASDGAGYRTREKRSGMLVHPRSFGTFPKFLKEYVREKNALTWEDAIHKITEMPAEKIGLKKRGKIEKGYFADIAIFDAQRVEDCATFKDPFQYSEGIEYVIINGGLALGKGKFQKGRYGKVLRK